MIALFYFLFASHLPREHSQSHAKKWHLFQNLNVSWHIFPSREETGMYVVYQGTYPGCWYNCTVCARLFCPNSSDKYKYCTYYVEHENISIHTAKRENKECDDLFINAMCFYFITILSFHLVLKLGYFITDWLISVDPPPWCPCSRLFLIWVFFFLKSVF